MLLDLLLLHGFIQELYILDGKHGIIALSLMCRHFSAIPDSVCGTQTIYCWLLHSLMLIQSPQNHKCGDTTYCNSEQEVLARNDQLPCAYISRDDNNCTGKQTCEHCHDRLVGDLDQELLCQDTKTDPSHLPITLRTRWLFMRGVMMETDKRIKQENKSSAVWA